jgi:hypothetical protein
MSAYVEIRLETAYILPRVFCETFRETFCKKNGPQEAGRFPESSATGQSWRLVTSSR